jgi:hypothetical protein
MQEMIWQNKFQFYSDLGVYKRNLLTDQLAGGARDIADDTSDGGAIPTPPVPWGISKWGQVIGQTNSNIHPFTGDMTGKRQNVAPRLNKDSI